MLKCRLYREIEERNEDPYNTQIIGCMTLKASSFLTIQKIGPVRLLVILGRSITRNYDMPYVILLGITSDRISVKFASTKMFP